LPPAEAPSATTDAEIAPGPQPSPAKLEAGPDYVIGPEDVLDVEVFNVPELTKTVRVANDGFISLPLLGRVKAAEYTTTELRNELESRWGETYLEQPQVSVFVRDFHARPVSVIGAVEKPGLYQLTGPRTLVEMLSMAGGLAKTGTPAGQTVLVTRKGGFAGLQPVQGTVLVSPDKLEINLQRLLYSRENALNIQVRPLDMISVSRAPIVYVLGDVGKPGGFFLNDRENITVMQALALAEGVGGTAAKKSARIIRSSDSGSRTEIPIDVGRILKGKSQDIVLAANDILYVPPSGKKAAVTRGAAAAVATLSGVVVYRSAR
jgi:polysaccharide export outer membrane protein